MLMVNLRSSLRRRVAAARELSQKERSCLDLRAFPVEFVVVSQTTVEYTVRKDVAGN